MWLFGGAPSDRRLALSARLAPELWTEAVRAALTTSRLSFIPALGITATRRLLVVPGAPGTIAALFITWSPLGARRSLGHVVSSL